MRSTLLYIPQFISGDPFGLPMFGWGWMLIAWLFVAAGLIYAWPRLSKAKLDLTGLLPYIGLVALGVVFVLPRLLVEYQEAGVTKIGLPIRTYGMFMVAAVISGVLLAAYRARRMGIDPEVIYSLAMLMTISGIVGARLFFVTQYWHEFHVAGDTWATLKKVINMPQGGLVVYGAVIGAFPVGIWYLWSRRLPPLVIADIVAPSLLLGLALGRVGCFMNGCCYGGFCSTMPPAVTFPAGSPPYARQEDLGWRTGIWLKQQGEGKENEPPKIVVAFVAPDSVAAMQQVRAGDEIKKINGKQVSSLTDAQQQLAGSSGNVELELNGDRLIRWTNAPSPQRSAPVHPAQLYAAIDAGLLALLLWVFYPFRRHDGEVAAIMMIVHPLSRILLEIIRVDEGGQFGTSLTISQWVSIGLLLIGVALLAYIETQPRGSLVPAKA
ncbi:Prolipoprotein diacylglyceryl transferase [Anatilimnocola aggregata]|uniref:Phosphatidylglycerol--prolipoprotein diacylglyceryl transferase n=1 Tax=Anatilimnocola aggregata TaxID=2528021 RepID=A0A517YHX1_9BACT|nr:prolipoprotein diacylglyceryl transferase family protein [Anatilimnocola aggregata]QDU29816.1 Prolipoprotein diacylglyceryl transferase [Anatilimnocola aggregata]